MSPIDATKKAKAVASETANTAKTLQAVIFDMSLDSEGDHNANELALCFTNGLKAAPSLRVVFDENPFILRDNQVNYNTSTIAQIADRRVKELVEDEDVKFTFTHRATKEGGVFLVEKRSKLRVGDKVETQISKIYKRVEYRKNDAGTFKFKTLEKDCLFTQALQESLAIISGNDFKQLVIDPILNHFRGFTFKSKSRYAFAKMNSTQQAELMEFCNAFINSTIPNFESNKLIYVEGETAQQEIGHAQKSIRGTLQGMMEDLGVEMAKLRNTPTENRQNKTSKKIFETIQAVNKFRNLLKMKSSLQEIKLDEIEETLQAYTQETKMIDTSKSQSRGSSRTSKLKEAKTVIESQISEIEKLKAELAALKATQAKPSKSKK